MCAMPGLLANPLLVYITCKMVVHSSHHSKQRPDRVAESSGPFETLTMLQLKQLGLTIRVRILARAASMFLAMDSPAGDGSWAPGRWKKAQVMLGFWI